jgi:hypothetical protein
MPRTTVKYLFEWRMLEAVIGFARRHGGSDMQTLLVELDGEKVHVGGNLYALRDALEERGAPHLFYDPFDPPEYRWLSWTSLSRARAEALLGAQFQEGDFGDRSYPESWGVMF